MSKATKKFVEPETKVNGKTDMERVGFFKEMEYISVGDPYVKPDPVNKRKKVPWITQGGKTIGAKQDGYFAPEFLTHNVKTPYTTLDQYYRDKEKLSKKLALAGPFRNAPIQKMACGKGSFCATINPSPEAMSPLTRTKPKAPFKFAFLTSTGKKGCGYGYVDVTINKYVPVCEEICGAVSTRKTSIEKNIEKRIGNVFHTAFSGNECFHPNPYALTKPIKKSKHPFSTTYNQYHHPAIFFYTSPTKKDGGMKAGTINPFPYYNSEVYHDPKLFPLRYKEITNSSNNIYMPTSFPKSVVQPSILQTNLNK
ncbi:hypothetical protein HELRODRAFT_179985 [Helobdella robusta]|uniref:Cilia-and flagella-associated protein 96 n=1 Tax=Helobdella robusta TaxID=6412 RepID=T1FFB1_HELRO|nr:hypothetical protein HELRODRAFT_179985 [Helobdella robusta]ESN94884.1 hypothetical protein HELRODRAFT_179985 [Helobdella robusta]